MLASHPKLHAWTYQTIHVVSLSAGNYLSDFRGEVVPRKRSINLRIFMGEVMSEMTWDYQKKWPG